MLVVQKAQQRGDLAAGEGRFRATMLVWTITSRYCRASPRRARWVDTEVEEIDVAAEVGGRELFLPGFLLRTVRAFDI